MRKLTIILLCLIIYGCEVDKEEKYSVTGTYNLVAAAKIYREYSGDQGQYRADKTINLFNDCSRNSSITINQNGTFEIMEFAKNDEICESDKLAGTWAGKEYLYNNSLGEFKLNNSNRVYEIYGKEVSSDFTIKRIEVTYGSILDDPSGRFIYTYHRTY